MIQIIKDGKPILNIFSSDNKYDQIRLVLIDESLEVNE